MIRRSRLLDFPYQVPLLAAALLALGLLFVRSSTAGTHLDGLELRQFKVVLFALPVFLLFACTSPRRLARNAFLLYGVGILLLAAVLFVGVNVGGARRWFDGPEKYRVQPSEVMKPLLVLALARWLEFRETPDRLRDLVVPALLTLIPFVLVSLQPDLGTALLYVPVGVAIVYAAGARKRHFAVATLLAAALVPVVYASPLLHDYQKERVRAFLTSVPDLSAEVLAARRGGDVERAAALEHELTELARGAGYQSYCAQTSIGSGGLHGKGLGQGPQNRLAYLPARHTDFVFAVIAEEWGFLGSCAVLGLFVALGLALLSVAAGTRDRFGQLVGVGAAASIVPQAFFNVAMASGLLPVTGVPLPFISQGGSSLLANFALLGMVVAVARNRHAAEPFLYPAADPRDPFAARAAAEPVRERL